MSSIQFYEIPLITTCLLNTYKNNNQCNWQRQKKYAKRMLTLSISLLVLSTVPTSYHIRKTSTETIDSSITSVKGHEQFPLLVVLSTEFSVDSHFAQYQIGQ